MPSAAKRDKGVDKNAICWNGGSGGGHKTPYASMGDLGVDKNAICCK
jgi:hypothetical protein